MWGWPGVDQEVVGGFFGELWMVSPPPSDYIIFRY